MFVHLTCLVLSSATLSNGTSVVHKQYIFVLNMLSPNTFYFRGPQCVLPVFLPVLAYFLLPGPVRGLVLLMTSCFGDIFLFCSPFSKFAYLIRWHDVMMTQTSIVQNITSLVAECMHNHQNYGRINQIESGMRMNESNQSH